MRTLHVKDYSNKLSEGGNLFGDAKRSSKGPWGVARNFASISKGLQLRMNMALGKANIAYEMLGKPIGGDRYLITKTIIALTATTKLIEIAHKEYLRAIGVWVIYFEALEATMWGHIAIAHHNWNIKEEKYNIAAR